MIYFSKNTLIYQIATLLIITMFSFHNFAQAKSVAVGQFSATINKVEHLRTGTANPVDAQIGSGVEIKDLVTTQEKSRAQVTFVDETALRIASLSQVEITEFMFDNSKLKNGSIRMIRGTLRSIVHHTDAGNSQFKVITPTAVAAVRGTDFFTIVLGMITRFVCNEGSVEIRNIDSSVAGVEVCTAGHTVDVENAKAPTSPAPTDPTLLDQLIAATDISESAAAMLQEASPAQGGEAIVAEGGLSIGEAATALGMAAIGAVAVGSASSGVPGGAIPGGGTATAEDSIYVMQQWNVAASPMGAASGPDANHVVTVTRDTGNNITSVTIAGTHTVPGGTNNGAFSYTFNTPISANELALGGAASDTPAALGAGPNSIIINQIEGLPIVAYQYVSLFHWGVQLNATDWLAGSGVTGTLTPLASIPGAGTATYTGVAQGWIYSIAGLVDHDFRFNSTLNVTADFGANQITNFATTGTVTNAHLGGGVYDVNIASPGYDFALAGAAPGIITGNTFTAGIGNANGFTGAVKGGFFGPAVTPSGGTAVNKPANIGGSFTATQATVPNGRMHGVFVGQ